MIPEFRQAIAANKISKNVARELNRLVNCGTCRGTGVIKVTLPRNNVEHRRCRCLRREKLSIEEREQLVAYVDNSNRSSGMGESSEEIETEAGSGEDVGAVDVSRSG